MTRTASAIAIVLAALALAPASASSAELTGCVTKRGTLTNVAPGPRPARPCSPQQAKRVSIPVISGGAGRPGTARVDSYSFWKEISSEEFGEIPIILVEMRQHERPIGFWGACAQFQEANRLNTEAYIFNDDFYILRGEGESDAPYNTVHEVARRSVDATLTSVEFVATREVFTLIDYRNRNVMMRVDLVTSMVTDQGQPTSCTFSGTAELFRPR